VYVSAERLRRQMRELESVQNLFIVRLEASPQARR
jgi:hypothetical protein